MTTMPTPRMIADRPARMAQLRAAAAQPTGSLRVPFRGQHQDLVACRVPHTALLFRLANGRTIGEQRQLIVEQQLSPEFFQDDAVPEAQEQQERILAAMSEEKDLVEVLAKDGQTEPLLVTVDAIVINGNRRLAGMRKLAAEERAIPTWPYVEIAILPEGTNELDILAIEAHLQIKQDVRADYQWYDEALLFDRLRQHGRTVEEIATGYGKSVDDVNDLHQMLVLARQYLEAIRKPDAFQQLAKHKYAFSQLQKEYLNESNPIRRDLLLNCTFYHMQREATAGRRYDTVPSIHKHLDPIVERIGTEAQVAPRPTSPLTSLLGPDADKRAYQAPVLAALRERTLDPGLVAGCIDEVIAEQERRLRDNEKKAAFDSAITSARDFIDAAFEHLTSPATIITPTTVERLTQLEQRVSALRQQVIARLGR